MKRALTIGLWWSVTNPEIEYLSNQPEWKWELAEWKWNCDDLWQICGGRIGRCKGSNGWRIAKSNQPQMQLCKGETSAAPKVSKRWHFLWQNVSDWQKFFTGWVKTYCCAHIHPAMPLYTNIMGVLLAWKNGKSFVRKCQIKISNIFTWGDLIWNNPFHSSLLKLFFWGVLGTTCSLDQSRF